MNDHRPPTTDHRPGDPVRRSRRDRPAAILNPLVSLIVVTYNSAALLPAFFVALEQTTYAPYEVLLVDNASRDGTPQVVAEQYPAVRLIAGEENLGFGRACNQGAQAACGELLVFLNPDVLVTPGWLATLVGHAAEYPDAAILCPATLYRDQPALAPALPIEETAAVPACAMLVRRSAWHDLGGFDEQIFLYWEDTELCWRAWLLGWRVLVDPQAIVYHERGGSAGGRRWDVERTKNSLYTYLKLMRWRRTLPFVALLIVKTLVKLTLHRQRGLAAAWVWNARNLGLILAQRRVIARRRVIEPERLEQMIALHHEVQAGYRRARRASAGSTYEG